MSSENGNEGFLDRMVKLVSSPGRSDAPGTSAETTVGHFDDVDKAELKAMIERKRRNDFVRKREFDMLRRIRREGLTGDQVHQLEAASSRMDETETRPPQQHISTTAVGSVKAKIDAIEKQMVGTPTSPAPHVPGTPSASALAAARAARAAAAAAAAERNVSPSTPREAHPTLPPTMPMHLLPELPPVGKPAAPASQAPARPAAPAQALTRPAASAAPARPQTPPPPQASRPGALPPGVPPTTARPAAPAAMPARPPLAPAPAAQASAPAPAPLPRAAASAAPVKPAAPPVKVTAPAVAAPAAAGRSMFSNTGLAEVEVSEIGHDQELDEAVIAFANAEFAHCERLLVQITSPTGPRYQQSDTWLVLFDLYRATGQQPRFDALTLEFAQHFQRSAPQWFSLPRLVMEASAQATPTKNDGSNNEIGWVCPARLDLDALAQLTSQLLQLPTPWVFDWRLLMGIDTDAAAKLHSMFTQWANSATDMRWLNPDRLLAVLQEATPVAGRDVDPAFWHARLGALRLINRPDQFDEVAIDYCVTYEVSPPSWEPAKGTVHLGESQLATQSAPLSVISDPVTSTLEGHSEQHDVHAVTTLELSGQLSGDIGTVLSMLDSRLGDSMIVHISCALLIRVDFIAAGDLLNWVIAKRAEGRYISFTEVHRLVALMFGAMGITEHATVKLRQA